MGTQGVAEEIKFEHVRHTDVMFVDYCAVPRGARVETVEVGDLLGFPGQVQARVNPDERVLYGITIQNYSGFRRRLFWTYKMASVHDAMVLLLNSIRAGVSAQRC